MEKEENTLYPEILSITYSHEEFLNKVSNAELFITSPGLTIRQVMVIPIPIEYSMLIKIMILKMDIIQFI